MKASSKIRYLLRPVWGLTCFGVAVLVWFGFWSFPVYADPPSEKTFVDVREMSVKERAELGEKLIFGAVGASRKEFAVGKAQCPLCHGFSKNYNLPTPYLNLYGVTKRAKRLIASPQYQQRPMDTKQPEAFPGSGIATNVIEYLAESNVCPSCYVVPGHGVKGTEDRESLMPHIHKPPISLSIDEFIAIDTWLYVHEGQDPPSPQEIENAYRKFIPASEWPIASRDPEIYPARYAPTPPSPPLYLSGQEPIDALFTKALCFACHEIPGISGAVGVVGPKLVMKTNGPQRLKDPRYKGKATNVREYILESIVNPSIYVVKGYPDNLMPKDYRTKLSDGALDKMAEYLSQLEESTDPPKKVQ